MDRRAHIKIVGTKVLLFHAFNAEVLDKKKAKSGSVGNNPDEWKGTVIMDSDRKLYLPESYLFAPIKEAGKYTKIGRGNIVKYVAATLAVSPHRIYIKDRVCPVEKDLTKDDTKAVYLDVRSVVNPMTKGRNLRYRIALSPGWETEFEIGWDDSLISTDQMQAVVNDSGTMCGTGDARNIGLGRYKIKDFSMI